jgi:hypothetical protein
MTTSSNQSQQHSRPLFVEFDNHDYKNACTLSSKLVKHVKKILSRDFKYFSFLKFEIKHYDFKISNSETQNGIQICIPPYNVDTIEMYYIVNGIKNYKNIILLDYENPIDDIQFYINKHLFNEVVQKDKINQIFIDFNNFFKKFSENFTVTKYTYNISFVEKSTNNGYNFYIDTNKKNNYVSIRIIQNRKYYNHQKYNVSIDNFTLAEKYVTDSIASSKHNIPIVYYKILRCDVDPDTVVHTDTHSVVSRDRTLDMSWDEESAGDPDPSI